MFYYTEKHVVKHAINLIKNPQPLLKHCGIIFSTKFKLWHIRLVESAQLYNHLGLVQMQ